MNHTPITPTAEVPEEVAEHDVEVVPEVATDAQGMSRLLTGRKPGSPDFYRSHAYPCVSLDPMVLSASQHLLVDIG